MADTILVTPEELINTAEDFQGKGTEVRNITQEMISLVDGLSSIHEGEAATAFHNQFHQLDDDMDLMYQNITKHVKHLNDIAAEFTRGENKNITEVTERPTAIF